MDEFFKVGSFCFIRSEALRKRGIKGYGFMGKVKRFTKGESDHPFRDSKPPVYHIDLYGITKNDGEVIMIKEGANNPAGLIRVISADDFTPIELIHLSDLDCAVIPGRFDCYAFYAIFRKYMAARL